MGANSGGILRAGVVFPSAAPDVARSWIAGAHELARMVGARMHGPVEPPAVGRSFYRLVLLLDDLASTLMLNPAALLVACVEGDPRHPAHGLYVRVPHPELFTRMGLLVADPASMEEAWDDDDLVNLAPDEADQVRYHQPSRIGDIFFNWFD